MLWVWRRWALIFCLDFALASASWDGRRFPGCWMAAGIEEIPRRVRRAWTLAAGWCVLMFLIQVGRLNIALDFDTLWYGVRSQYIVAGGTGLYENPGLVGMVYVYSKGFEVLTLPLCDLASHSYLTFFNLWLAVLGIGAMVWNAVLLTGNRKQETEKKLRITASCRELWQLF